MVVIPENRFSHNEAHISNQIVSVSPILSTSIGHYANTPMQYTAILHSCKNVHFQMKFFNIFFLFLPKTLIVGKNKKKNIPL